MPTLDDYADFAEEAYLRKGNSQAPLVSETSRVQGYDVQKREWATWVGNGFQGVLYQSQTDVVVAFAGTMGKPTTAPVSQNTANLRIGAQMIPNMAGSAFRMVRWAQKFAQNRPVSVVGHSLGGGLAQVVGNWTGCPFISFNGPGMQKHLAISGFNVLAPMQMARTVRSNRKEAPAGFCYRVTGDFVGNFGTPLGHVVDLPTIAFAGGETHSLDAVRRGLLQLHILYTDPFA